MNELATIVPMTGPEGSPTMARGTRVMLADGSELKGVTRIELIAEVDSYWKVRIDCMVNAPTLPGAVVEINHGRPLSWWRKALLRMAGVDR